MNLDEFKEEPPVDKLEELRQLAVDLQELEAQASSLEEMLDATKKQIHHQATFVMPEKMTEAGVLEFTLSSGKRVGLKPFVSGSLPKDAGREKAIAWLEENGGGPLLTTNVVVKFPKSRHGDALELAEDLQEEGYLPTLETGIHPQTLYAFVRERLKRGEEVDADVLGLFVGQKVKVTDK